MHFFDKKREVYERIDAFKRKSNFLLERYGNGAVQHYQHENAICTYLWLRYPDKYYIYKLNEIKAISNKFESSYTFKKAIMRIIFAIFWIFIMKSVQSYGRMKNLRVCLPRR